MSSTRKKCTLRKRYSRLYGIWRDMKTRCYNKNSKSYKYYGGRGISVCYEWQELFENFFIWAMENGYKEDLTIDRIDVNGDYEPENCRWISMHDQQYNKRLKGYDVEKREQKYKRSFDYKPHKIIVTELYVIWYKINSSNFEVAWDNFDDFYSWAKNNGYVEGMPLYRKNDNKSFTPDNCYFK